MDIELRWQKELALKYSTKGEAQLDLDSISKVPGVYIFGRRHGKLFEALYIGRAKDLRGRVKTQLNTYKLMNHVRNAKSGKRIVMIGEFKPKQAQTASACLPIAEKALIRHFVAEGHDIVNVNGVTLWQDVVSSTGVHRAKCLSEEFLNQMNHL